MLHHRIPLAVLWGIERRVQAIKSIDAPHAGLGMAQATPTDW
jgi:hypothetical protein